MKTSSLFSITFVSAALILGSTGCQHRPQGITIIPHEGYTAPPPVKPDNGNNNGLGNGATITPEPKPAGDGSLPFDPNRTPWTAALNGVPDTITLGKDAVYFDFDSATIKKSEEAKLEDVAKFLQANMTDALRVEGNCDERGTEKYNLSLGERRALAVREYLHNLGIDSRQVATVTYGAAKPVDPGHNEAAWKKNRRGDMVVMVPQK